MPHTPNSTKRKKRKEHGFRIAVLLLAALLTFSAALAASVRAEGPVYDKELAAQIEREALALLEGQFQAEQALSLSIQETIVVPGSARVDVQLSMIQEEAGEVQDLIHVFALHDGTRPLQVFREPSASFYLYADEVSRELLPRERLEFWKRLRAEESKAASDAAAACSDCSYIYKLPWDGGVIRGVCQDDNNHFDFQLLSGTQVRAARGGTVYVKRASEDGGCCSSSCDVYNNYVCITHCDGSYGWYLHLKFGGITVNTGNYVLQGDCLGLSGNTGWSCGAHLHFNVSKQSNNTGDWYTVSFVEGAMPAKPANCGYYNAPNTPASQNSTAPCGSVPGTCCGCLPAACCSGGLASAANPWGRAVHVAVSEAAMLAPPAVAAVQPTLPAAPSPVVPTGYGALAVEVVERAPVVSERALPVEPVAAPAAVAREPVDPLRVAPASANYLIPKAVFGSGGGPKASTNYRMNGTQGQTTDLSLRQSSSYRLIPGYWGAVSATPPGSLGGVNDDGLVNSTDALIILTADVGLDTSAFCPMNCGDVNGDGLVNSTDALIVLTYDVGLPVPFPLGAGACPTTVTQPPGCNP